MEVHSMRKTNRFAVGFGSLVLVCVCLVGGISAAATGGDQEDPLVTLSYLTKVVTPELMQKVDEQVAANEKALTEKLDKAIDEYSEQMKQVLSQGSGESSAYAAVSLKAGQSIRIEAGGELLLSSGAVKVSSGTSPALLDATDGGSLSSGGSLKGNHLYVVSADGCVVAASSDSVLMVRGLYT